MSGYEDAIPTTCPICGIGWESTDLRRHPDGPLPWWRCSDCGAEWSEWHRQRTDSERPSEQIVRELAVRGPLLEHHNTGLIACADCGLVEALVLEGEDGTLQDPAYHEPSCLWRRARELYPQPVVPAAEFVIINPAPRYTGEMGKPPGR